MRIHDAVSFIKRIAEVGKAELSAALDDLLSQLLIINDVRNLILHHPVSGRFRKGRFIRSISNIGRALTAERIKEMLISERILMDMEYDLFRMQVFLFHEYACLALPPDKRGPIERLGPVHIGAWLYKPAPQSKNGPRAPPVPSSKANTP